MTTTQKEKNYTSVANVTSNKWNNASWHGYNFMLLQEHITRKASTSLRFQNSNSIPEPMQAKAATRG
jgi:hypothetical protein